MPLGDEQFEQQIRSGSVHPPRTLYKYTSAKTALAILTKQKLRHRSPLNYNDPFDSQWDPLWFVQTADYADKERALLDRALRDPGTWPQSMDPQSRRALQAEISRINALHTDSEQEIARNKLLEKASATRGANGAAQAARSKIADDLRRMRVLCLCESNDSMLMWSHYAEEHRGIVLGLDSEKYEQFHRRPFEKVTYSSELPLLFG